jgi:FtsZ-binding cell division protein ZapB
MPYQNGGLELSASAPLMPQHAEPLPHRVAVAIERWQRVQMEIGEAQERLRYLKEEYVEVERHLAALLRENLGPVVLAAQNNDAEVKDLEALKRQLQAQVSTYQGEKSY